MGFNSSGLKVQLIFIWSKIGHSDYNLDSSEDLKLIGITHFRPINLDVYLLFSKTRQITAIVTPQKNLSTSSSIMTTNIFLGEKFVVKVSDLKPSKCMLYKSIGFLSLKI